jgi:hypothetical protein
MEVA